MSATADLLKAVLRDYEMDGVPSSGDHWSDKGDLLAALLTMQASLDALLTAAAGGDSVSAGIIAEVQAARGGLSTLSAALTAKATVAALNTLTTTVGAKAAQSALDALTVIVGGKAAQAAIDALSTSVTALYDLRAFDSFEYIGKGAAPTVVSLNGVVMDDGMYLLSVVTDPFDNFEYIGGGTHPVLVGLNGLVMESVGNDGMTILGAASGAAALPSAAERVVLDELRRPSIWHPGMKVTATRTDFGLDLSGSGKFTAAVLGADGAIWLIPGKSATIMRIVPSVGGTSDTATRGTFGSTITGAADKWLGGALHPNGKIYCAPWQSDGILVIDTIAGTAEIKTYGLGLTYGGYKWRGAYLGRGGKIYCIPDYATSVLVIDPATDTASLMTATALGLPSTAFDGVKKWSHGCSHPNGKIYGAPYTAAGVLVIDTTGTSPTATIETFGLPAFTAPPYSGADGNWYGAGIAHTGEIFFSCFDAADFLIVNPMTGLATRTNLGLSLPGGDGLWNGIIPAPDGKLYLIPLDSRLSNGGGILIVDPVAKTAVRSFLGAPTWDLGHEWHGGALAGNGIIYGAPMDETTVLRIGPFAHNFRSDFLLSPFVGAL